MDSLTEIRLSSLSNIALHPDARISEFRHLSSYNWIDVPTPTIAVPGSPAKWSPPNGPIRLDKDTGYFYVAQNVARHPESPLEPLFRALLLTEPSVDLRSIDVVTDRNNIRKLLSFVDPGTARGGAEDFVIKVEVVGQTALFSREEAEVRQYIAPSEFRGYGHEFEKVYTKEQIKGSTGHYRIVEYRFGGLKFLVRNEVDGYVPSVERADASNILAHELSLLSLSKPPKASYRWQGSKLEAAMEGEAVPSEQCLEIKTKALDARKPLKMESIMPQLWVSQTTKLVRAYHTSGFFQPPDVEDMTESMKSWEQDNENTLKKLAAVIAKILEVARRSDGPVQVKYSKTRHQLVLSKIDSGKMLPDDLYLKWNTRTETEDSAPVKTLGMASDSNGTITVIMGARGRDNR
ncbi:geranylgeranyl pyrophosphate synthetase [Fusarium acuminatum]|uniref:Geranylgeranyl pyrophosphate synthetase n=1 Tax=Fusarium acuminatum TaxID=5515 RepID=A0ABZ2WTW7_9HYPO